MKTKNSAIGLAILAASLYAVNIPFSKIIMNYADTTMIAAFLYIGAGFGMFVYSFIGKMFGKAMIKEPLTKNELPYTVAMVVLDIIAPILLMMGIARTNSANVSLLNNFEIVATSLIALVVFKEIISKKLFVSIVMVTIASIILGFDGADGFVFNTGSLFVIGASTCWGFENNCTKMISSKSSIEIVIIKGCFSGIGSLIVALLLGETIPHLIWIMLIMLLGFVSYGLSINFYIMAQKNLGAAKTSAFYSVAPFLGVVFSIILLNERPGVQFYIALIIMLIATLIMARDTIALQHSHEHSHTHTHEHRHGEMIHSHEHSHIHTHNHVHSSETDNHGHIHNNLNNHNHFHTFSI